MALPPPQKCPLETDFESEDGLALSDAKSRINPVLVSPPPAKRVRCASSSIPSPEEEQGKPRPSSLVAQAEADEDNQEEGDMPVSQGGKGKGRLKRSPVRKRKTKSRASAKAQLMEAVGFLQKELKKCHEEKMGLIKEVIKQQKDSSGALFDLLRKKL